jgi:ferredoxin
MARTVTLLAEIIDEKCTGCDLCIRVCPTLALSMRDRKPSELGKGKRMVEVDPTACYNVQNCVEICPHEAIVMRELAEPFTARTEVREADHAAIAEMAAKAGYAIDSMICVCTETTTAEICAAILQGADTPAKVSLATGARTGCTEICAHGLLKLLAVAGHVDPPEEIAGGWQHYGICGTLWEHLDHDGKLDPQLVEHFSMYPLDNEVRDLAEVRAAVKSLKEDQAS